MGTENSFYPATGNPTVWVLRADDFVALRFELVNLGVVKAPARLERVDQKKPAYLLAHFPQQHIGEQAFLEDAAETSPDPGILARGVQSRIAGTSRLAFLVPPTYAAIPFTVAGLLKACRELPLNLAVTALPPATIKRYEPPVSTAAASGRGQAIQAIRNGLFQRRSELASMARRARDFKLEEDCKKPHLGPGNFPVPLLIKEPSFNETALELPYRLILSPNRYAAWSHAFALDDSVRSAATGRTELWHSRLIASDGTRADDPALRTVRAIWTRDRGFDPSKPVELPPEVNDPFCLPLNYCQRYSIVRLTSDYGLAPYTPQPIAVERLLLTSLGSWVDTHGSWKPDGTGMTLSAWDQRGAMGRDNLVRVVEKGHLFPFGHEASLVRVTERKFDPNNAGNTAYLRQRSFVVVKQPLRYYSFGDRDFTRTFPFSSVRITTLVTPNLDPLGDGELSPGSNSLFWPRVNGQPFLFHLAGEGLDGNPIQFTLPLLFADINQSDAAIRDKYEPADSNMRTSKFESQSLVLAPCTKPGDTTVEAQSMTFGLSDLGPQDGEVRTGLRQAGWELGSYPSLQSTSASIPTLKHLGRNNDPTNISYDQTYVTEGFGEKNKGETFAAVAPTGLNFSGQGNRSGGLVKPDIDVSALSRLLGPAADAANLGKKGTFAPGSFFSALNPQFLGVLKLSDIVPQIDNLKEQLERVPKFLTRAVAGAEQFLDDLTELKTLLDDPRISGAAADIQQQIGDFQAQIDGIVQAISGWALDPGKADALKALLDAAPGKLGFADRLGNLKIPAGTDFARLRRMVADLAKDVGKVEDFIANLTSEEVTVKFDWKPRIWGWGFSGSYDPKDKHAKDLIFIPNKTEGGLEIHVELRSRKNNPADASFTAYCCLSDFKLDLVSPASFIGLHFEKIEFVAGSSTKPDVNVLFADDGIKFIGVLHFIERLRHLIPLNGLSDPPALDVTDDGIDASYSIGLPNIALGMLSIQNLSLEAGVTLPFVRQPLSIRFNFCERQQPFLITVSLFGGGGYFSLTADAKAVQTLEAAFEFGGCVSVDFGVASGGCHIMAGIYYSYKHKPTPGKQGGEAALDGYFRVGGHVEVLGIVSVSIELCMDLHYEFSTGKCVGRATINVEIDLFFFSMTVEISCERKFAGSDSDPTFAQIMEPDLKASPAVYPWREYCVAFA